LQPWQLGNGTMLELRELQPVPRTIRKAFGNGGTIPWINYSSAHVNFYYFYCLDEEFGPFFIKFCSYFPYTAKLCINDHEYLKCQPERRGIEYEALDNGISWSFRGAENRGLFPQMAASATASLQYQRPPS
jgi:hypothetical protein